MATHEVLQNKLKEKKTTITNYNVIVVTMKWQVEFKYLCTSKTSLKKNIKKKN